MVINRALDLGLTMADLETMTIGMIVDILAERREETTTPRKKYATMADIEAF